MLNNVSASKVREHHEKFCDVFVAGGGISGVCCAIAAARNGVKVILCQDRPVLGGNASSEIRMMILGADALGRRGKELETEVREGGILEEIRLEGSVRNPQRSDSIFDLILYEKCITEPNLELLLNTTVASVEMEGKNIKNAFAHRESTEDAFRISAKVFVDCTGDGRLGVEAGAPYYSGRESKDEYKESYAPDNGDKCVMGSSILFQARRHDHAVPFKAPSWARKFSEHDLRLRPHASPLDHGEYSFCGLEFGYWWVELGGRQNTIKENESNRHELLAVMLGVWDHIKNDGDHGADNWALEWFGFTPGKRESRRFIGQHVLTQDDLMDSKPFNDAIGYGGWTIDLHAIEGIDGLDVRPATNYLPPYLYSIPLSCCISRDIENLMFAGRNISATHVAFASTRVMGACAVIGQGVGTAAAYAGKNKISPCDLTKNNHAIKAIQQNLIRDDAYLIGELNEFENDLVKTAKITASSQQKGGEALNIMSGQTRAIQGPWGAPADRSHPGLHRWISENLPAWIELCWEKPVEITEISLVFDTGMHRILTMSHSDGLVKKMMWGMPQPETVKDYNISYKKGSLWQELVNVKGNYQRLCRHNFKSIETQAIRINVNSTNGIDHARIFEISVC
ncbi:MAG: FAD-dependent oxidoreductase [Sedimentisphaerales bacterium]|nr:FAD-dependent oxidoreductase [Sedimentisphaerales bacterium]